MTDMRVDEVAIPATTDLPSPAPDSPLEALSWLGNTVEEVAEGLRARRIKGTLKEEEACPLARYLGLWWSETSIYNTLSVDNGPELPTPDPCWKFIVRFDSGDFPDLIDNG